MKALLLAPLAALVVGGMLAAPAHADGVACHGAYPRPVCFACGPQAQPSPAGNECWPKSLPVPRMPWPPAGSCSTSVSC
jgi:hypothetical protein